MLPSKHYKQGYFVPTNKDKYVGDITKIRYMSSWEHDFNKFLDTNPNILRWSSEEIVVPYIKPTTGKVHRYYPDYWIEFTKPDGSIVQEMIEIKPHKFTQRSRSRNPKTKLLEDITYGVNMAKWEAASRFCAKYGIRFRVATEKELYR